MREAVAGSDERLEPEVFHPAQNAAAAFWEAEPENRGRVGVVGAGDRALLEAAQRLARLRNEQAQFQGFEVRLTGSECEYNVRQASGGRDTGVARVVIPAGSEP